MDPSLSISNDPHHPPQFTAFPPFANSNPFVSGAVSVTNHPLFGGPVNPNPVSYNNHGFQAPPLATTPTPPPSSSPLPPHPSFNHPHYSEMICAAIAALNEPDGSSKQAISRYIERIYTGLPPAHAALLTHHLKTLKNSGVLNMVKKSYKFASSRPESVAVAAAAAAATVGLESPRSEPHSNISNEQRPFDSVAVAGSVSQTQKRGRGRPPKAKPEVNPSDVQPNDVQSNGQPNWEQAEVEDSKSAEELQESSKRRPGRPRKDGAPSAVSVIAGMMKRRGRPPGRRAAGRQRKPKSVSATASVFPYVANGAKRRGRPRRTDSGTIVALPNAEGGETVAVVAGKRRGRPPKIGGVMSRLLKPRRVISRTGRPVGRPRKNVSWGVTGATGRQDSSFGELKKKFDLVVEKAKEIAIVLKSEVGSDNQTVMQAIHELEGLANMDCSEPHVIEEVQPEEEETHPEAETQGEEEGHEREGQEQDQEQEQGQAQSQTEAEAMQEALF